jgi:hypothetical protein
MKSGLIWWRGETVDRGVEEQPDEARPLGVARSDGSEKQQQQIRPLPVLTLSSSITLDGDYIYIYVLQRQFINAPD